jgi:hypothetical protein
VVKNNLIFANPLFKGEGAGNVATEGSKVIVDYNGYNEPAGGFSAFYSKGRSARSLAELAQHGLESHGVMVDLGIFRHAEYPSPGRSFRDPYGTPYPIAQFDLQLKPSAKPIDAGVVLPNINDSYIGAAPDLGCYEFGRPPPHYGPRVATQSRVSH